MYDKTKLMWSGHELGTWDGHEATATYQLDETGIRNLITAVNNLLKNLSSGQGQNLLFSYFTDLIPIDLRNNLEFKNYP
jgi:hypothetical protein